MKSEAFYKAIDEINFAMYKVMKACEGEGQKVAQNYAECKQWADYLMRRLRTMALYFKQREEQE